MREAILKFWNFQNFRIKNQDFQDFATWMGQVAQIGHLIYSDSPGHPIGPGHGPLPPDGL